MEKPLALKINDLKTEVVTAINESELPLVLVRYVLGELDRQLADLQRKQDAEECMAWQEEQNKEATE